jgi:hypothetical protein
MGSRYPALEFHKIPHEIVITDANHVTQVGYTTDPKTGKEFKAMEIVSTRA